MVPTSRTPSVPEVANLRRVRLKTGVMEVRKNKPIRNRKSSRILASLPGTTRAMRSNVIKSILKAPIRFTLGNPNLQQLKYTTRKLDVEGWIRLTTKPKVVISKCDYLEIGTTKNGSNYSAGLAEKHSSNPTQPEFRPSLRRSCKESKGIQNSYIETTRLELPCDPPSTQRKRTVKSSVFSDHERQNSKTLYRCSACEMPFPSHRFLTVHEVNCLQLVSLKSVDIRKLDAPHIKVSFMRQFGMIPVLNNDVTKSSKPMGDESYQYDNQLGRDATDCFDRTRHHKLTNPGSYFRNHYSIPVSGTRGQNLIRQSSTGLLSNPEAVAKAQDRLLWQAALSKVRSSDRIKSSRSMEKKDVSPYQYTHLYSFSKKANIERNTELIVGLKSKQFEMLNQCRFFQVPLKRLNRSEINMMVTRNDGPAHRIVLPNPCRGLMKKCEVKLYDLKFGTVSERAALANAVERLQSGDSSH